MSNKQQVTGNEQKLTSDEQKLTSMEQRAKSFTSWLQLNYFLTTIAFWFVKYLLPINEETLN